MVSQIIKVNLVVPCVMDYICNETDEEVGLETWLDFDCVIIRKTSAI